MAEIYAFIFWVLVLVPVQCEFPGRRDLAAIFRKSPRAPGSPPIIKPGAVVIIAPRPYRLGRFIVPGDKVSRGAGLQNRVALQWGLYSTVVVIQLCHSSRPQKQKAEEKAREGIKNLENLKPSWLTI